jgi:hypothetical protein
MQKAYIIFLTFTKAGQNKTRQLLPHILFIGQQKTLIRIGMRKKKS